MKNVTLNLEIISKEEKWWAKLTIENFSGKSVWLDEQKLFGESLKSNLFVIKNQSNENLKYIGFQVNSSSKKYIELKDKETKTFECNLSKSYKIEKDEIYTFQYLQPVLFLENPEQNPSISSLELDSGEVSLHAKEVFATLSMKHFDGLLIAELEFKNNGKRDVWLDLEAVGGTKILKQDIFKITDSEGNLCRFKNVTIVRNNVEKERFVKLKPQEFYWTRNNLSSKYNVPANENLTVQYHSEKAYAYLKPVEDDKDTLLPMSSNAVQFVHHSVSATLEITQEESTIFANLTFTNKAKTNVWLNTKYLGSEDLEYNVFTFQDDNGIPASITFKPQITTHAYEYDVDHFIELAPGDNLQTQVNLNRNYIIEEQGRYLIKYEAPALMWKQPKALKDYDPYSDDDFEPVFDMITSERVAFSINDAADPIKVDFSVFLQNKKAFAKLTITAVSAKKVRLDSRKIGGDMMGTDIFQLQDSFGVYADFINPKHDDGNEETIVLEKGDSLTTETCLNDFYEIKKDELYTVRLFNGFMDIDLKQYDDEATAQTFIIPAETTEAAQAPLVIEFTHSWGTVFDVYFKNKGNKSLWINGSCLSPESTRNYSLLNDKNEELNRKTKPEPYTDWVEIEANDVIHNVFDIADFWKATEGNNYSIKFQGVVYTLKNPYDFEDDSKIKLESVLYQSKLFPI